MLLDLKPQHSLFIFSVCALYSPFTFQPFGRFGAEMFDVFHISVRLMSTEDSLAEIMIANIICLKKKKNLLGGN